MGIGDEKVGGGFVELSLEERAFKDATRKAADDFESALKGMARGVGEFGDDVMRRLGGFGLGFAGLVGAMKDSVGGFLADQSFQKLADQANALGVGYKETLEVVRDSIPILRELVPVTESAAREMAIYGVEANQTGEALSRFLQRAAALSTRARGVGLGQAAKDYQEILVGGPGMEVAAARYGIHIAGLPPGLARERIETILDEQMIRAREAMKTFPQQKARRFWSDIRTSLESISEFAAEATFGERKLSKTAERNVKAAKALGLGWWDQLLLTLPSYPGKEQVTPARVLQEIFQDTEEAFEKQARLQTNVDELATGLSAAERGERMGINKFNRIRWLPIVDTPDANQRSGRPPFDPNKGFWERWGEDLAAGLTEKPQGEWTFGIPDEDVFETGTIQRQQLNELKEINRSIGVVPRGPGVIPPAGYGS